MQTKVDQPTHPHCLSRKCNVWQAILLFIKECRYLIYIGYKISNIGYRISNIGYKISNVGYKISNIGYKISYILY